MSDQENQTPSPIVIDLKDAPAVVTTGVSGVVRIDDMAVADVASIMNGRASNASLGPNGVITHGFIGSPSQGEERTLSTCRTLVAAMNLQGLRWKEPGLDPQNNDDHADASSEPISGDGDRLLIQVVRANVSSELWMQAAKDKRIEIETQSPALIRDLLDAVELKTRKVRSAEKRARLVLALDASELAGYALGSVPNDFRTELGDWALLQGFKEIWLVGRHTSLTYRLA
jgi:hypothetical protein